MGWLLRLCVLFAAYHPAAPFLQPPLRAAALHGSRTVAGSPALSPAVSAVGSRDACISMGVPKFFRWLTERFPQINVAISEGRRQSDWVDNFYLDMNGIIHQCTHGDEVAPGEKLTEEEMVERIFAYTERLISIARPRKILYLAIDGVAPRAKMNQQRQRRYRVARERRQAEAVRQAPAAALIIPRRASSSAMAVASSTGRAAQRSSAAASCPLSTHQKATAAQTAPAQASPASSLASCSSRAYLTIPPVGRG